MPSLRLDRQAITLRRISGESSRGAHARPRDAARLPLRRSHGAGRNSVSVRAHQEGRSQPAGVGLALAQRSRFRVPLGRWRFFGCRFTRKVRSTRVREVGDQFLKKAHPGSAGRGRGDRRGIAALVRPDRPQNGLHLSDGRFGPRLRMSDKRESLGDKRHHQHVDFSCRRVPTGQGSVPFLRHGSPPAYCGFTGSTSVSRLLREYPAQQALFPQG